MEFTYLSQEDKKYNVGATVVITQNNNVDLIRTVRKIKNPPSYLKYGFRVTKLKTWGQSNTFRNLMKVNRIDELLHHINKHK